MKRSAEDTNLAPQKRVCKVLSEVDHVLARPAQYIGGITTKCITEWMWDDATKCMISKDDIKYNEGLVKIIFEVIDNAIDNVKNGGTTTIDVTVTDDTVTIKNDGDSIPVTREDLGNGKLDYIPTTLFGAMRSGSNFNEERDGTIGMNGLGVKLTNITSKSFTVTCNDKVNGSTFNQTWTNNMRVIGKPKVKPIATTSPKYSTIVSFKPDIPYFHDDDNNCNIATVSELSPIIYTRLIQLSATHPSALKLYFNGKAIKIKNFKAYMKLFTTDHTFHDISTPSFEYGVTLSSTGAFQHQSFVNCQRTTSNNSSHTKYVTSAVTSAIASHLKKKGVSVRLSPAQISNHLFIFVKMEITNPKFTGQTKAELDNFISPKLYPIDVKRVIGLVKKSGLLDKLEEQLSQKALTSVQKTLSNSTKKSTVSVPKLDDAAEAGKSRSLKTTLFLVEGDSAKTLVTTGMSVIGRDYYGVFPLKGKLLNVLGATMDQLKNNAEIINIMKIVGLDISKKYDNPKELKTLRYGKVCCLCDADVDGTHITGLILTFFHHYWPALVKGGFLLTFITPIIKAVKGTIVKRFFTISDYDKWAEDSGTSLSGWHIQHLKGLGTSLKSDTLSYFKNMASTHLKELKADDDTGALIKHIFDPKESNWRKEWLLAPMTEQHVDFGAVEINISKFLRTAMHAYSMYNIKRAVPSALDGLKVSQRKVIHACLDKFTSTAIDQYKVAQLSSFVAAKTNYAHGEVSLQNTITNMAQSFSGANNIPLLTEGGAFGSRRCNGSDAACPRYIFTKLHPEARHLFRDRSKNVLEFLVEENVKVEPTFYVPTLPMILINGTNGIATGFRSVVPLFNPADVMHNIQCKLDKTLTPKELMPWYGGTYKTNHKTTVVKNSWVFQGEIAYNAATAEVIITEVPIGVSFEDYGIKVLAKLEEKGVIKEVRIKHVSENEPRFVITGYTGTTDNLLSVFKLTRSMSMNCMNLLNTDGIIQNFKTPEDILDYWYAARRVNVDAHHKEGIRELDATIEDLFTRYKFVKAIVDDVVPINKRATTDIVADMVKADVCNDEEEIGKLLNTLSISSLSVERYKSIKGQYDQKKAELEVYKGKSVNDFIMSDIMYFK